MEIQMYSMLYLADEIFLSKYSTLQAEFDDLGKKSKAITHSCIQLMCLSETLEK